MSSELQARAVRRAGPKLRAPGAHSAPTRGLFTAGAVQDTHTHARWGESQSLSPAPVKKLNPLKNNRSLEKQRAGTPERQQKRFCAPGWRGQHLDVLKLTVLGGKVQIWGSQLPTQAGIPARSAAFASSPAHLLTTQSGTLKKHTRHGVRKRQK